MNLTALMPAAATLDCGMVCGALEIDASVAFGRLNLRLALLYDQEISGAAR